MQPSDVKWCVDKSLEEIKKREKIMEKLYVMQPLTTEELFVLRSSLTASDSLIGLLQRDLKTIEKNEKKRKFFRFTGK